MRATEVLEDIARRPLAAAEALRPKLDPEVLNAHPHHDNSIAWLLWHAAREMDAQVAALSGRESVWISGGFDRRFGLALPDSEVGYGQSGADARAVVVTDPDLLVEHLGAVTDALLAYLASIDDAALDDVVDAGWDPPVTRAARLVSLLADALEHIGQAAYLTGMRASAFEG